MSIYHILIINRAGSLVFDWESGRQGLEDTKDIPRLTTNEKIVFASVFHLLNEIKYD